MKKSQKSFYIFTICFAFSLIAAFAIWWFQPSHLPHNFGGYERAFDVLLFLLISYIIWHPLVMDVLAWSISSNIKKRPYVAPQPGVKIALITTFVPGSESVELLHKTLPALVAVEYAHDTWILDEGDDQEVKRLCEIYGVNHFSRKGLDRFNEQEGKFASRTKGGNHNSWYDMVGNSYDIVAQMDTDFIPHKDYLNKTLGYFSDPQVAFVGTPQIYGNTSESLIAKGAAQQTLNFYGPILRGMDGMDTTLLIGANHVISVAALKSVDHYSAHITEDLLTGMKLHAKGWKSVYIPEALAIGEGPTDWASYFKQQKRWAYGCMHILFNHSPKLFRKMKFRRILYYFLIQQHYFSGIATAISVLCLVLYFGLGLQTSTMDLVPFLSLYIPVILVSYLINTWLQRFNIRPKEERGIMWAGMYISMAVWPIFFIAFVNLFKKKRLVYQVTPKGRKNNKSLKIPLGLFAPHFFFGLLAIGCIASTYFTQRLSPIMLFWAVAMASAMLLVPIIVPLARAISRTIRVFVNSVISVNNHFRLFELKALDAQKLPSPPSDKEKYSYVRRNHNALILLSMISFACVSFSMAGFLIHHLYLWPLSIILGLSIVYFSISLIVNTFTKSFNLSSHKSLVESWKPSSYPSVDVFLPVCGEPLGVLENTWKGVSEMVKSYPGNVTVYCLDDSDSENVKILARDFNFNYIVRENRGYFKKAGNLRYGFERSSGDFINIFDADFVPRKDFLSEVLPYFDNPKIGIVQTPQYFDVDQSQNWLERGAGAVQELFYRVSQVSRNNHGASICVGSNAIYRRRALNDTGGTALIEHSEDVHTGFNLRMYGWQLEYIPIVLAKGLCPSSMTAFFKQQYRWCLGSLSLMSSEKFWKTKLSFRARLSYVSGFLYYLHTGITSFYTPFVPLVLLLFIPHDITLINYALILPSFAFSYLIYPLWHRSTYGVEAWATRSVYGWAHLFAIFDKITNKPMGWQPTGTKAKKDTRYSIFRSLQFSFNFVPAVAWVGMAAYYMIFKDYLAYMPIFVTGIYYLFVVSKVTFYMNRQPKLNVGVSEEASISASSLA